jgi:hypothetical protein
MTSTPTLAAHISTKEAFALSGCTDQMDFKQKLNRLLGAGLSSISRLNRPGSQLEDTPPLTWIDGTLFLDGQVVVKRSERLREEHRHTEVGVIVINHDSVWPVPRFDVRFLRTDFIEAWTRAFPTETLPETPGSKERDPKPQNSKARRQYRTRQRKNANELLDESYPDGFPKNALPAEVLRTIAKSSGYKTMSKAGTAPSDTTLLRHARKSGLRD